ncbi:MAG: MBL fold metallo-hydrolase RNA specificity domain-containing protein [Leifsonia sp.]
MVILPAFAVGRAETLLLHLSRLRKRGEIPDVPVFLNSPMAVNASDIYQRYPHEQRNPEREFRDMYSLATLVRTVDDSKLLNLRDGPAIIISASGMLEGGRILRIFGQDVPIRAQVVALETLSAHADATHIMDWLQASPRPPRATFVTHGEPEASDALRVRIQRTVG